MPQKAISINVNMLRVIAFCVIITGVPCENVKKVKLDEGVVVGEKYWNGDFYEFYSIPFATAPTGRDKYKAPLPPTPWTEELIAKDSTVACYQAYPTGEEDEVVTVGEEQCLILNVLTPTKANEDNPAPVIVYIHSGAYVSGFSNMAFYRYLARHDIVVVSVNYRLGVIGFTCLGNEDIPGNAAMKDQVAALKWIKKNIKKFGGDPSKVTVAGFSVGASMAELLTFSESTDGLIDKIILESASALTPFAIHRDPISSAKDMAVSFGYNGTGSLKDLTEFYLATSVETFTKNKPNFYLKNSTFEFAPCIEKKLQNVEPFLTQTPLDVLRNGKNSKVAVLTGFANMEGLSRVIKFEEWIDLMNEKFEDFLPVDLRFPNEILRDEFIDDIKNIYFKGEDVSYDTVQGYIDYFSDSMFKYPILKSAKLHAANNFRPVFVYEFSYVGKLNMRHQFMDKVSGASHRDQTAYVLEFNSFTNDYTDLDKRDQMTMMWADFTKFEDPTAYESPLIGFKWLPYSNDKKNYLQINDTATMRVNLFENGYQFWDKMYEQYYWHPKAPINFDGEIGNK